MNKTIVSYSGFPLHITYDFTHKRDIEVARKTVANLREKYVFNGEISYEDLQHPDSDEQRIVFFRETIGLSNQIAAKAGLISHSHAKDTQLIMPEKAYSDKLLLPFVGAFLPPDQLEIATKLSIYEISPTTQVPIPLRLQQIQKFSKALKYAEFPCIFDGWTVLDIPGADFAAKDLLAKGGNVLVKYGRGSFGQYQWTFHDYRSYKKTIIEINETMKKKNINWEESGLVFERKLGIHDQLIIGQQNFMGQLISWIGRMDHAPVINTNGEKEIIYTGSTKIFILGSMKDFIGINLPSEVLEDIAKAKQFGKIMEEKIQGGAITRIQYNLLRGAAETAKLEHAPTKWISGITEVTLRVGGGSAAEMRAIKTLSAKETKLFTPISLKDKSFITQLGEISMIVISTYLEYFPTEIEYNKRRALSEGSEIIYDGTDPIYGFVRIYTRLHKVKPFLNNTKNLIKFLYPNTSSQIFSNFIQST